MTKTGCLRRLFSAAAIILSCIFASDDISAGLLKVSFINVGQGDAIYIQFPSGNDMLIDTGPPSSREVLLGFLESHADGRIDYLVLTHPHSDHIGGVPELFSNLKVGTVYDCGIEHNSSIYLKILDMVESRPEMGYMLPVCFDKIDEPGVEITMLHPQKKFITGSNSDLNENSIVIRIKHNNVSFLFTGDIGADAENIILGTSPDLLDSTVLKVPHHGSHYSSTKGFLNRVRPEYAVIQVGLRNKYRHPGTSVLVSIGNYTENIYRNDFDGDITFVSDGYGLKVSRDRSGTGMAISPGTARRRGPGRSRRAYDEKREDGKEEDEGGTVTWE